MFNQTVDPAAQPEPDTDARRRRPERKRKADDKPELKLTSMIDVIFLLLIFFVITASFTQDEGAILATLPGSAPLPRPIVDPAPLMIELASSDDGVTYTLRADGRPIDGVTDLYGYLSQQVADGSLAKDDVVQIKPQGVVRWQHVVNVFNTCVRADLQQVGLSPS